MTQPLSRLDGDTTERGRTSTYYAGVALCAADLGTDDDASRPATWTQEQKDAWADAPFRLTMADVAEAWKGRDRCADDHMWPKPTPVPCTVPSSDDGDCCTFEELEAALTQLASETADGNSPVPTTATSPPAPRSLHTAPQSKGPSTSNAKRPESTTTSCRDTHVRRNESSKNRPSGSVDEEIRPGCLIRTARQPASLRPYWMTEKDSSDEREVIQCYCHTCQEERQARVRDARPLCLATCCRWTSRTKESYEG